MGEQSGQVSSDGVQPLVRLGDLPAQSFELLHGPSQQVLIDTPCQGIQLGAVEGSVVADPAAQLRIDFGGESGQVRSAATVQVPGPDLLPDRLLRLGADRGCEACEEPRRPRARRARKV